MHDRLLIASRKAGRKDTEDMEIDRQKRANLYGDGRDAGVQGKVDGRMVKVADEETGGRAVILGASSAKRYKTTAGRKVTLTGSCVEARQEQ